jgi:hypothetical protein
MTFVTLMGVRFGYYPGCKPADLPCECSPRERKSLHLDHVFNPGVTWPVALAISDETLLLRSETFDLQFDHVIWPQVTRRLEAHCHAWRRPVEITSPGRSGPHIDSLNCGSVQFQRDFSSFYLF